jgi:four helix bundle protein
MLEWLAMPDFGQALKERTNRFALDVLRLLELLPDIQPGLTTRRQLAKSATSVAANYRAARRARSHAEFTARIGVVAEEADETLFW